METLANWSGHPIAQTRVVRPDSERQLCTVLRDTTAPVRVVGSRFSRSSLLVPSAEEGVVVDASALRGVVSVTADAATFRSGTTLGEVYEVLRKLDRMLPCSPGVISAQTIAGAIATGTHGQGLKQSSLADVVTCFRVVGERGEVWECDETHPWFGAMKLNLGCLGIVTEVTVRTVPFALFTCLKYTVSAEELRENYVRWNREFTYCKAWWFLDHKKAHVWLVRDAERDEARLARGGRLAALSAKNGSLNGAVRRLAGRMRRDTKATGELDDRFRTITRFMDFTHVTGDIYQILCKGIPVPQINVEIALPLRKFEEVMGKINSWYAESDPALHYPIIMRSSGPSGSWLSPSYGEESVYFGFLAYRAEDGTVPERVVECLREIETILADEDGRPHWGKYFTQKRYDWSEIYPRWNDFREVRLSLDGGSRFGNQYLHDLLV